MRDFRLRVAVAAAPALLAAALRLYDLGRQPLWLDEIITHNRALLPLPALISDSLVNRHFPTYFLLARAFDASLIDAWALRLPSVAFGSLAVLMVALIATEVRSPRAGLAAGLLMALSPIDVEFSQEARSYAMVSCLILVALWGLVRIVKLTPTGRTVLGAPLWGPVRGMVSSWTAVIAGTIAALYTLMVATMWWVAANLAFAVIALRAGARRATLVRHWLLAQAVIAAAWLPGFVMLATAGDGDPLIGYRWLPPSTWQHVSGVLSSVYLYRAADVVRFALLPTPVPWLGFVVLALALSGVWQLRAAPRRLAVVACAWLTMPVAMFVISAVHTVWIPRYLAWSTGGYYVLAGIGLAALPRRTYALALVALVIAAGFNLAPYYRAETKPRWDLAANYLATHAKPGDGIISNSYPLDYVLRAYARRAHLNVPIVYGGYVAQTVSAMPKTGTVWLVHGRTGQSDIDPNAAVLRKWSALGPPTATLHFGNRVVIWRFQRNGP